jgi:hypothetical protein
MNHCQIEVKEESFVVDGTEGKSLGLKRMALSEKNRNKGEKMLQTLPAN